MGNKKRITTADRLRAGLNPEEMRCWALMNDQQDAPNGPLLSGWKPNFTVEYQMALLSKVRKLRADRMEEILIDRGLL